MVATARSTARTTGNTKQTRGGQMVIPPNYITYLGPHYRRHYYSTSKPKYAYETVLILLKSWVQLRIIMRCTYGCTTYSYLPASIPSSS